MLALDVRRETLGALAAAIAAKALVVWWLAQSGADFALGQYVAGAAFVPQLEGRPDAMLMLACLLPQAIFVFLACDFVPAGLTTQASCAMPRLGTRTAWTARRTLTLAALCLDYVLAGNAAAALVLALADAGGLPAGALSTFAASLPLELLASLILTLLANLAALWIDAVVSAALVLGVHAAALMGLAYAPLAAAVPVVPWLPSARAVLAWHDAAGMDVAGSCALLAVLGLLAALALARSVARCDIL